MLDRCRKQWGLNYVHWNDFDINSITQFGLCLPPIEGCEISQYYDQVNKYTIVALAADYQKNPAVRDQARALVKATHNAKMGLFEFRHFVKLKHVIRNKDRVLNICLGGVTKPVFSYLGVDDIWSISHFAYQMMMVTTIISDIAEDGILLLDIDQHTFWEPAEIQEHDDAMPLVKTTSWVKWTEKSYLSGAGPYMNVK